MKFFNDFFSTIYSRSHFKFTNNLFFLRQMLSDQLNHTLVPHIFVPSKSLKIKFFNNTKHMNTFLFFYSCIFLVLLISIYIVIL